MILVPVLARPGNVGPLLASIRAATPRARVLFLTDANDHGERRAIEAAMATDPDVQFDIASGGYAFKINRGILLTMARLIFTGADDLRFAPGWFAAALAVREATGADVIGTQDLCNPRVMRGEHSTHFLVTRDYCRRGQLDGAPGLLSEEYGHEKTDDELVFTSRRRGAYAFADDAIVQHLHPDIGRGEWDSTYAKGRLSRIRDRKLFRARRAALRKVPVDTE